MKTYPVTLLTGFLGSGKSSLINRLLKENPHRRLGLVLNEFGEQSLESQIIQSQKEPIFELPSGCLCCVGSSDLKKAFQQLIQRNPALDHIVVEASGLTSPGPILQTLTQDSEEFPFTLSGVFCVVDASQFLESQDRFPHVKRQLNWADAVFLTKTDLVDSDRVQQVVRRIETLKPSTRIHRTDKPILWAALLDSFEHKPVESTLEPIADAKPEKRFFASGNLHDAQIFEYESLEPLDPARLKKVFDELPASILRAKGSLWLDDKSAEKWKYIVQYSGRQKQLYSRSWNSEEKKQSYLLFIGTEFDASALRSQLDECRVLKEKTA